MQRKYLTQIKIILIKYIYILFRYKGYYYDQETNLYYCNLRYYSPEIFRWISRDEIEYLDPSSITGCNLYAYCCAFKANDVLICSEEFNFCLKNDETYNSLIIILFSRRKGKTPPVKWPQLPKNLAGKKPKWNSKGYWDGEKSGDRYREDGSPLPGNKNSDLYNVSSQLFHNYDSSLIIQMIYLIQC